MQVTLIPVVILGNLPSQILGQIMINHVPRRLFDNRDNNVFKELCIWLQTIPKKVGNLDDGITILHFLTPPFFISDNDQLDWQMDHCPI